MRIAMLAATIRLDKRIPAKTLKGRIRY